MTALIRVLREWGLGYSCGTQNYEYFAMGVPLDEAVAALSSKQPLVIAVFGKGARLE